eukprot:13618021-Alexandrium_andersonii.AAC.1
MGPNIWSQVILAFNTIVRCGRDREAFDTMASKPTCVYGKFIEKKPETAVWLFCAFRACAETSPNYASNGKSARKGKRKPDEPRPGKGTGQASS